MKPRKKDIVTPLVMGTIVYLILLFGCFHYSHVLALNPRLNIFSAIGQTMTEITTAPFALNPIGYEVGKAIAIVTVLYFLTILCIYTDYARDKHDDLDTSNGSQHWMTKKDLEEYNKKFTVPFGEKGKESMENIVFCDDMALATDTHKTRMNLNVLVIGGSGSGKSRFVVKPNLLQRNSSFVVTDPSGELLQSCGHALEDAGYKIKSFNLCDMEKSNHYNPFEYIRDDLGVVVLVNCLIKNTTPPEGSKGDPFWEKSETALLQALIFYLVKYCPKKDRNFASVMKLLRMAEIDENDSSQQSPLDRRFEEVERQDPNGIAVKQYKTFKMGAGKTLKSILISCSVRLTAFNMIEIANLTNTDDIHLQELGNEKQALFVVIPAADDTFNFLVSMMYSQLFETEYFQAENECKFGRTVRNGKGELIKYLPADKTNEKREKAEQNANEFVKTLKNCKIQESTDEDFKRYNILNSNGEIVAFRGTKAAADEFAETFKTLKVCKGELRLPVHVRFLLDEFANIGEIPQFVQKLSTMRKYEISCTIILQALSQLKKMYKDDWGTVIGNCDSFLYLGGQDYETWEYISKRLGKATIKVRDNSVSKGGKGGSNLSYKRIARDLASPDEIGKIDSKCECILMIKGLYPYIGKKYTFEHHPNYKLTEDADSDNVYLFVAPDVNENKETEVGNPTKNINMNEPQQELPEKVNLDKENVLEQEDAQVSEDKEERPVDAGVTSPEPFTAENLAKHIENTEIEGHEDKFLLSEDNLTITFETVKKSMTHD